MEAFASLHYKILFELIPAFAQSIKESQSIQDPKRQPEKCWTE
jgi:hypothetical protein